MTPGITPHPSPQLALNGAQGLVIGVQLARISDLNCPPDAKRARLGAKPGSHQSTPSHLVAGAGGARAAGLLPFPATVKRQPASSPLVPNPDIIFSPG